MNSINDSTQRTLQIHDVIYAEHYSRRIASAVHEQIVHFADDLAHALVSAYPEGSAEYYVVIEALKKAGLSMVEAPGSSAQPHDRMDGETMPEAGGRTMSEPQAVFERDAHERSRLPIIKGPWKAR